MPAALLVVIAKQPQVGRTKTRLCPPISPEQAAAFYEAMLMDTLEMVGSLPEVQLGAALTPLSALEYFESITPPKTWLFPVEGADLGECLQKTFQAALEEGFQKVFALNSDGPSLPRQYLLQAINLLEENDLVLGPGQDGGYYLIGMKSLHPQLFKDIPWSTDKVFEQTLLQSMCLGLRTAFAPPWYDIDTAAGAARLIEELDALPPERLQHTRRFLEALPPQAWQDQ
jgi:uncharacterized protein